MKLIFILVPFSDKRQIKIICFLIFIAELNICLMIQLKSSEIVLFSVL